MRNEFIFYPPNIARDTHKGKGIPPLYNRPHRICDVEIPMGF
jgi:hypothetical protein